MKLTMVLSMLVLVSGIFASDAEKKFLDAVRNGNLDAVKQMVEAGVDVETKDPFGVTALMFASRKGHRDIAKYLLSKGADVQAKSTKYQMTALDGAMMHNQLPMAGFLIQSGAKGAMGVMKEAIEKKNPSVVTMVLKSPELTQDHLDIAIAEAEKAQATDILAVLKGAKVTPSAYERYKLDEATLKSYVGVYHFANFSIESPVTLVDGKLQVDLNGLKHMVPAEGGGFKIIEDSQFDVKFVMAENKVEKMLVTRGGRSFDFMPGPLPKAEPTSPDPASEAKKAETDTATAPVQKTYVRKKAVNWTGFRGNAAAGVADGQGVPTDWNVALGKNIQWKTPVPGIATSSPVIWENQVFAVTAVSGKGDNSMRIGLYGDVGSVDDESIHSFRVYGLDLQTGKVHWEKEVASKVPAVKRHFKSTQANASPVTDGKVVVSLFGSIGLMVCHDFQGKEVWRTDIGIQDSGWFFDRSFQWGHAASPAIYKDKVIVQADNQDQSFIAAYNLKTGQQVWRTNRDDVPTWGSPTVYEGSGRDEVVTNGTLVRGYDAATGKELWHLGPNSDITVATPVLYKNTFIVTGGYSPVTPVYAIRAGSNGDLTLSEGSDSSDAIAWSKGRGGTYMPTPIVYDGLLYTCNNDGRLTCYDAGSGEQVYRARISGRPSFSASPVASDGRLFFASEDGDVHVVKAGRSFEELAVNPMDEVIMSTPAISDGVMVVRTVGHVYGIGSQKK